MARCQTSRPIRGKSRMSESLTYGSVRGAAGDGGPYRDYSAQRYSYSRVPVDKHAQIQIGFHSRTRA
jgi:hypothetical protein